MEQEKKQTALVPSDSALPVAVPVKMGYWDRVARLYTLIFRIMLFALPLYVVVFMALCARAFTYESIFCFVKDLRATTSFVSSEVNSVSYTYEEQDLVLSYRGGIAAVSKSGVEIYSPDGARLLDEEMDMASPRAAASRKYLVTFDFGRTEFSVMNTYAALYRGETEFPIYMARAADTGHFAFVTSASDHLSHVLLYDGNFNLIQRFRKSDAVVGMALSENGKYIALLSLATTDGEPCAVVSLYRIGEQTPSFTVSLMGELPVALDFTGNRALSVLTDAGLRVYSTEGTLRGEVAFAGRLVDYCANEQGCAVVLEQNTLVPHSRVILLDKRGKLRYDGVLEQRVTALSLAGDSAMLLSGEQIFAVDEKQGVRSIACEKGATSLLALDEDRVRAIYPGKAMLYIFE